MISDSDYYIILYYCIVLYCIVLYCIVLYCVVEIPRLKELLCRPVSTLSYGPQSVLNRI